MSPRGISLVAMVNSTGFRKGSYPPDERVRSLRRSRMSSMGSCSERARAGGVPPVPDQQEVVSIAARTIGMSGGTTTGTNFGGRKNPSILCEKNRRKRKEYTGSHRHAGFHPRGSGRVQNRALWPVPFFSSSQRTAVPKPRRLRESSGLSAWTARTSREFWFQAIPNSGQREGSVSGA